MQSRKAAQDEITRLRNSNSDKVTTARQEIARLRDNVNQQIVQSNTLIANLRNNLTVGEDSAANTIIDQQQEKIKEANNTIDNLTQQKYSLEAEARKLEAEVGPVKYIAELVYGDTADKSLLEEAVRWVILLLVAVFDPLAIVLVLAGVMTIHRFHRPDPPDPGDSLGKLDPEVEPELEEPKDTEPTNQGQVDDKLNEETDTSTHESNGTLEPENPDENVEPVATTKKSTTRNRKKPTRRFMSIEEKAKTNVPAAAPDHEFNLKVKRDDE